MTVKIWVQPDHPCWKSFDDDDWNGHTFGSWVRTIESRHPKKTCVIVLHPPSWADQRLIDGVANSLSNVAFEVQVERRNFDVCEMQVLRNLEAGRDFMHGMRDTMAMTAMFQCLLRGWVCRNRITDAGRNVLASLTMTGSDCVVKILKDHSS